MYLKVLNHHLLIHRQLVFEKTAMEGIQPQTEDIYSAFDHADNKMLIFTEIHHSVLQMSKIKIQAPLL